MYTSLKEVVNGETQVKATKNSSRVAFYVFYCEFWLGMGSQNYLAEGLKFGYRAQNTKTKKLQVFDK